MKQVQNNIDILTYVARVVHEKHMDNALYQANPDWVSIGVDIESAVGVAFTTLADGFHGWSARTVIMPDYLTVIGTYTITYFDGSKRILDIVSTRLPDGFWSHKSNVNSEMEL
ncbi:hypothetical protein CPT_Muldoon_220 [Serratia phage Muldoon]|uniref:Uncharacterized protein n=1 Tax=Serratia phage Muldoon TaxID=2601678 RepID=A0A5P8PHK6_9CAUD|nr:hypothetical protein HYP94_gp170 [Serratia phage Muldoon]QFR56171.1 hypothetical protein CPT_Muldoon_220 [Serratia phage Muldoon]